MIRVISRRWKRIGGLPAGPARISAARAAGWASTQPLWHADNSTYHAGEYLLPEGNETNVWREPDREPGDPGQPTGSLCDVPIQPCGHLPPMLRRRPGDIAGQAGSQPLRAGVLERM